MVTLINLLGYFLQLKCNLFPMYMYIHTVRPPHHKVSPTRAFPIMRSDSHVTVSRFDGPSLRPSIHPSVLMTSTSTRYYKLIKVM